MTDAINPNPYAPPRALVEDAQADAPAQMVPATRLSRFLAVLVDSAPFLVFGVLIAIIAPAMFMSSFDPNSTSSGAMMTLGIVGMLFGLVSIGWLIWMAIWVHRYGQTIGKRALGIRVVRMDGSRVSMARFFFLRNLSIAVIGWVVMAIGMAIHMRFLGNLVQPIDALLIFGAARRCLHDQVADTQVVTAASSPNATLEGSYRV